MHDDVTLPFDDGQRGAKDETQGAWGSFRLIARVGYGGFGEVYRAWDPNLEREVALKLLLPNRTGEAQSEDEYKAMLREARTLASVRHPNIVPVYGIDRNNGRVGFWTDFVKGKTLSMLVGAQGPFGDREATLIGLDVTRALSAVHRAGILHRDIKAENVMREEGGRILLMDFGLSTLPVGQTNIAGTPNYMAPELWQGIPASVESDIYAMGVLLYFLVTGEHPAKLGGLSTQEATEAIAHRRPLMDLRSDLPESFLRTVGRAMEDDPANRYTSAGQLASALAECLGTGAPVELLAAPVAAKKSTKQRWAIPLAGAALVLGAVAVKTPAVQRWLHLETAPASGSISSTGNEQYIKAQELLKKPYKDANVTESVTTFQQILKDNPKFALAEAGLASAYYTQYRNSGDEDKALLSEAKTATDTALTLQADLAPALATRARIEAKTGDPNLALTDATDAIEKNPHSPEAFNALAEAYYALGRKDDAIKALQSAIDLDPDNSMLLVRLGGYYLSDGKVQMAAAAWKQAVGIDPENTFALYNLGIVDIRLNRLDDAELSFKQILKNGDDADSYGALGTVFVYKGDYRQGIDAEKKAISLNPRDQRAWANLGSTYIWTGSKKEDGVAAYRKAIELAETQRTDTPNDAELLIDLADYYATIKEAGKSIPLLRKALALSPNDPKVVYFAGETYELIGDRAKGIPLVARALAAGFPDTEFEHNPDLAGIRNDPAFGTALKQAQNQNTLNLAKQTH